MATSGDPSNPLVLRAAAPPIDDPVSGSRAPTRTQECATSPVVPERISLPNAFADDRTLEARYSGAPHADAERAPNTLAYWRAYTSGVTEEAPDRYHAEAGGELGRGAIGRVFLAHDSHLDRPVAIKELLDGASDAGDRSRALHTMSRFLREAR